MENLDFLCQQVINRSVARFLEVYQNELQRLPERYLSELAELRAPGCVTLKGDKLDFGKASGLAFVLQHGSEDYPALRFASWLDRVIGEQLTRLLEGT